MVALLQDRDLALLEAYAPSKRRLAFSCQLPSGQPLPRYSPHAHRIGQSASDGRMALFPKEKGVLEVLSSLSSFGSIERASKL